MRKIVPSTRGKLTVTVRRRQGSMNHARASVRFGGIRDEVNILLAQHEADGAIQGITIQFVIERAEP